MPVDIVALTERLNEQRNVVAGVSYQDDGQDRLRVTIEHDEWRTTNLFPSQYERVQAVLEGTAWAICDFTIRQKSTDDMDDDADSDFVVAILELEPVATSEGDLPAVTR